MKKRVSLMVLVLLLVTSSLFSAYAGQHGRRKNQTASYGGSGAYCGLGYSFMCDDNGVLISKDAFEAKLDKAITDGSLRAEDRAYYLSMYEYCSTSGGGGRGACCGR